MPDRIEAAGARSLGAGDATLLGSDIIHSVVNPIEKWTRAIHVWNLDDTKRLFAEAEARAR